MMLFFGYVVSCMFSLWLFCVFFFFKQKTAYEMRISDWSSDVCSSDLTETGRQLWSDRFEDASSCLFELQVRIASRVAGAINPRIRASEIERARRHTPENLQAYDLVLRALPHFWAHRKEDNEKALVLFDEALARDPDYGVALAFKAWCHAQQTTYLWAEDIAAERAKAIA